MVHTSIDPVIIENEKEEEKTNKSHNLIADEYFKRINVL